MPVFPLSMPKPSLGHLSPSSPGLPTRSRTPDVSPTYELLSQYSHDSEDSRASSTRVSSSTCVSSQDDHSKLWIQIQEGHDGLTAKQTSRDLKDHVKEAAKSELQLGNRRDRSEQLGTIGRVMLGAPAMGGSQSSSPSPSTPSVAGGVALYMDSTPSLLKTLDEVARLHVFIGVAVLAFKVVYELETKRRENDKRIVALYVEMKDMMAALAQLRNIKSEDEVGPDGLSIKTRLMSLIERTAEDIKMCANQCDTYSKKKLLVKIIKGADWERSLLHFVGVFQRRKAEFEFALQIHTGLGIDKANSKLDVLEGSMGIIQSRMDVMLAFFQTQISSEQRELAARVKEKGGAHALLDNDRLLREVLAYEKEPKQNDANARARREALVDIDDLKAELKEDPETALKRNFPTFARKFEMQQRQIVDELSRVMHREGDRIIDAVTAGPHDKIIDPDLHAIWKEMGWRGSVKARHFVLALRDHFRDKVDEKKQNYESRTESDRDEEWALEWINITRLQPIVEAFDDDASGFITVNEANEFTTARPRDWKLLHWLAYWAIGWQIAATAYRDRINDVFAKMFSLKSSIHPAVRTSVDKYLHAVWPKVSELTAAIQPYYPTDTLKAQFQSYIDAEEQRLREGLEAVRYDFDAMDTLALVTGSGRMEKYVFPLLCLLLEKDYEVMRLARTKVINKDELWDAADTIEWVFQAVDFRYKDLRDIFNQQKLNLKQQFSGFACGLFEHWRNSDGLWGREMEFPEHVYNDEEERQDVNPDDILNYPLDSEDLFDPSGYDAPRFAPTEADRASKWPIRSVLGPWCGFLSKGDLYPCQAMLALHVHALDGDRFEATSKTPNGTTYTLTGSCHTTEGGTVCYTFVIKYAARFDPLYFEGYLSEDEYTFSGTWGATPEAAAGEWISPPTPEDGRSPGLPIQTIPDRFLFKRLPPAIMCCRPDPALFKANKPRALWKFALTFVEEYVGRNLHTWSYFTRRRNNRKRYIELLIRLNFADLNDEEYSELAAIRQTLTAADARLYETRYDYELRTTPIHLDVTCDHCSTPMIGPRIICLDCESTKTVNLCDTARCRNAVVDVEKRPDLPYPHEPSHSVFKLRTMMHLREFGRTDGAARAALKRARATFKDASEVLTEAGVDGHDNRLAKTMQRKLACISCKERVHKPCWYCIACEDDVFVCAECDAKGGVTVGTHDKTHSMVRCQDEVHYGPLSVEQRLELFDHRFGTMESKFGTMEGRFGTVANRVEAVEDRLAVMDDRLARIEKVLDSMWTRMKKTPAVAQRVVWTRTPAPPLPDSPKWQAGGGA